MIQRKIATKGLILIALSIVCVMYALALKADKPKSKTETKTVVTINQDSKTGALIPGMMLGYQPSGKDSVFGDIMIELNHHTYYLRKLAKGKKILINFWGPWCPPCVHELPDWQAISEEADDWLIIGICFDRSAPKKQAEAVTKFINANKITFLNLYNTDEILKLTNKLQINGYPTTLLIDKEMLIRERITGALSKEVFLKKMKAIK